jgi:hypothetical protein
MNASRNNDAKRQQNQKYQQFKFRKNKTNDSASQQQEPTSSKSKKSSVQEPSLDTLIMIKHQIEQEIMRKNKLKETQVMKHQEELVLKAEKSKSTASKGKAKKKQVVSDIEDDDEDYNGYEEDDYDEDAPFIGDGAFSQSSRSSHGSTQKPLSREDKRRRNTAASARFRIKKKLREQALHSTAFDMTEKATRMEQRVHDLEKEIKWLKALLVEKNEERLKQLIKDRPLHSVAFPINNNNNNQFGDSNQS